MLLVRDHIMPSTRKFQTNHIFAVGLQRQLDFVFHLRMIGNIPLVFDVQFNGVVAENLVSGANGGGVENIVELLKWLI